MVAPISIGSLVRPKWEYHAPASSPGLFTDDHSTRQQADNTFGQAPAVTVSHNDINRVLLKTPTAFENVSFREVADLRPHDDLFLHADLAPVESLLGEETRRVEQCMAMALEARDTNAHQRRPWQCRRRRHLADQHALPLTRGDVGEVDQIEATKRERFDERRLARVRVTNYVNVLAVEPFPDIVDKRGNATVSQSRHQEDFVNVDLLLLSALFDEFLDAVMGCFVRYILRKKVALGDGQHYRILPHKRPDASNQ